MTPATSTFQKPTEYHNILRFKQTPGPDPPYDQQVWKLGEQHLTLQHSTGLNCVGYAVTTDSKIIEAKPLSSSYSAQSAELLAVICACEIHKDKQITIYTDSQYVFSAVHHFAKNLENQRNDYTNRKTSSACQPLATPTVSFITTGNNFADRAAK